MFHVWHHPVKMLGLRRKGSRKKILRKRESSPEEDELQEEGELFGGENQSNFKRRGEKYDKRLGRKEKE